MKLMKVMELKYKGSHVLSLKLALVLYGIRQMYVLPVE